MCNGTDGLVCPFCRATTNADRNVNELSFVLPISRRTDQDLLILLQTFESMVSTPRSLNPDAYLSMPLPAPTLPTPSFSTATQLSSTPELHALGETQTVAGSSSNDVVESDFSPSSLPSSSSETSSTDERQRKDKRGRRKQRGDRKNVLLKEVTNFSRFEKKYPWLIIVLIHREEIETQGRNIFRFIQ